eukprot:TRINITY_DN511_c0_g1_i3.p1 TRINITY_DN511_c0_g1~~TRINITY_DN511_c0_g1_i3.p1  ORF type:complete len:333 (+),score=157.68 TRINITY_DN511_c0_g1_i3:62-1060(+)
MGDIATSSVTELLVAVARKVWAKPIPRTIMQIYGAAGLGIMASYMLAAQKDVKGKSVLVTGGAAGLGKAMALEFARRGCKRIILWDINEPALAQTKAELEKAVRGVEVLTAAVDISRREVIYAAADALLQQVGFVDIVINNAGIVGGKPILEQPDRRIELLFNVNTMSLFWMAKKFLPGMMARNDGHFVTVSSLAGIFASPLMVDYTASKSAARGFNDALRMELAKLGKSGVKTLCVCPAAMQTELFKGFEIPGMPAMKPEYVAGQVADAVKSQTEFLVLPRLAPSAGMINQAVMPVWLVDLFNKPASNTMANFDGTKANQVFEKMETGAKL